MLYRTATSNVDLAYVSALHSASVTLLVKLTLADLYLLLVSLHISCTVFGSSVRSSSSCSLQTSIKQNTLHYCTSMSICV
jgi:hypothetical protein